MTVQYVPQETRTNTLSRLNKFLYPSIEIACKVIPWYKSKGEY